MESKFRDLPSGLMAMYQKSETCHQSWRSAFPPIIMWYTIWKLISHHTIWIGMIHQHQLWWQQYSDYAHEIALSSAAEWWPSLSFDRRLSWAELYTCLVAQRTIWAEFVRYPQILCIYQSYTITVRSGCKIRDLTAIWAAECPLRSQSNLRLRIAM